MTHTTCITSPQELVAYWLDELDEAHEASVEEHLLACAACSERLSEIVDIGAAIRSELLRGAFGFVLSGAFIARLKQAGLHVREYHVEPGGSVDCTVTSADDIVVGYMHAPLRDVRRLDVVIEDSTAGTHRVNDVPFDPNADSLVAVPSLTYLRTTRYLRQRFQLVAVDGVDERVIADYTFNHTPSP